MHAAERADPRHDIRAAGQADRRGDLRIVRYAYDPLVTERSAQRGADSVDDPLAADLHQCLRRAEARAEAAGNHRAECRIHAGGIHAGVSHDRVIHDGVAHDGVLVRRTARCSSGTCAAVTISTASDVATDRLAIQPTPASAAFNAMAALT